MSDNKNELSINVSNSSDVSIKNIHQTLTVSEKGLVGKEIEELLWLLKAPPEEREKVRVKLEDAKRAIEADKPKSALSKILGEAGGFLKDFATEAGKTAITALIKGNM